MNGPDSIPQCVADATEISPRSRHEGRAAPKWWKSSRPRCRRRRSADRPPPSGIPRTAPDLLHDDQLAVGVIRGLRAEGRQVAEDARVVGYGDLELATEGDVPLTTIAQPQRDVGQLAVERMLAEITEGPTRHHSVTVLEPMLVAEAQRRSSRDTHPPSRLRVRR
ncbi:substrate-binding domain-containing protein [Microbacterium deminutum]|uniref:substrate-binding domain-containing protein n=1 Tax=Microbacterium deminutum TaxID=344164 RepID=UPI0031E17DE2